MPAADGSLYKWIAELQWYSTVDPTTRLAGGLYPIHGVFGDKPDDPSAPEEPLTWNNVAIAALLLGINIGLSLWFRLGLSNSLVVAAARCVVQLTLLGLVLKQIFLTENPIYIFSMALLLGVLAAFEVTYWRSKRRFPWMYTGTLVAITGSAMVVALFGNAFALNMHPAYTAVKFIPTIGMLYGKCMIGVSIGMGSVMDSLDTHRDRVETSLCFGSSRWEATKPLVVEALRSALLPTITNMGITGLISIPGMMTGWILGGADVLEAAKYQQVILFLISASTASSTLLSVLFCTFMLVDKSPRLRLDRLKTTSKQHGVLSFGYSNSENVMESMTRIQRIRSNCRPASDMHMSGRRSEASSRISGSASTSFDPEHRKAGHHKNKDAQHRAKNKLNRLKASRSTSALERMPQESATYPDMDIEEAAEQCRRRCGKGSCMWMTAENEVAGSERSGPANGGWKGNWCACCPLRAKLQREQHTEDPVVCYGFHEDPGDIIIPHPPGLLNILPGSTRDAEQSGTRQRDPKEADDRAKHYTRGASRSQRRR
ncbi:hypothetical protein H4R24_000144 [Coemansia sp. RSA 988]|nr:hypothetical protein H4R24_000144 [Coemansia sp. RSA 988]